MEEQKRKAYVRDLQEMQAVDDIAQDKKERLVKAETEEIMVSYMQHEKTQQLFVPEQKFKDKLCFNLVCIMKKIKCGIEFLNSKLADNDIQNYIDDNGNVKNRSEVLQLKDDLAETAKGIEQALENLPKANLTIQQVEKLNNESERLKSETSVSQFLDNVFALMDVLENCNLIERKSVMKDKTSRYVETQIDSFSKSLGAEINNFDCL